MMNPRRARFFSALISPSGIHAVEYRPGRGGLRILRAVRSLAPCSDAAEAAERLAEMLHGAGARGGRISVAVSGFGSYQHLLKLPVAPRELLLPVVGREMRRFYPDLFPADQPPPVLDYVEIDSAGREPGDKMQELLVAGVPRAVVQSVHSALAARNLRLDHWTILPLVLQRLYERLSAAPHTSAMLLLVPGSPLLGLFHDGELRLFSEPNFARPADESDVDTAVEQIQRGALFLRQQFRGALVGRLMLAAEAPEVADTLCARLELPVEPLGPHAAEPGAMAALGAALDARSPAGLNLLPRALRPPAPRERWARAGAVAAAVAMIAASGWWGVQGARAEARAEAELQSARASLAARSAPLGEIQAVVRERQAHAHRLALLASLQAAQLQLPDLLLPLQADPRIRVDNLDLTRAPEGWTGTLRATAVAPTSAAATSVVDALLREYARVLPQASVTLDQLANVAADPAEAAGRRQVAIAFQMTFIVPPAPEQDS